MKNIFRLFTSLCVCLFLTTTAIANSAMIEHQAVKFRSLDKVTARTQTFEVNVGSTVKYGPLFIKVQSCQKNPPIEAPESAAFVQIWEISPEDKPQWIFSGWMFASSPGLSAMDHAVYDVWVLDCLNPVGGEQGIQSDAEADQDPSEASEQQDGESHSEQTSGDIETKPDTGEE